MINLLVMMAEATEAILEKGIMVKRIIPQVIQEGRVTIRKDTIMTEMTTQTLEVSRRFPSRDFTPVAILEVIRKGIAILTAEEVAHMGAVMTTVVAVLMEVVVLMVAVVVLTGEAAIQIIIEVILFGNGDGGKRISQAWGFRCLAGAE